jgi:hypothetical protein
MLDMGAVAIAGFDIARAEGMHHHTDTSTYATPTAFHHNRLRS